MSDFMRPIVKQMESDRETCVPGDVRNHVMKFLEGESKKIQPMIREIYPMIYQYPQPASNVFLGFSAALLIIG